MVHNLQIILKAINLVYRINATIFKLNPYPPTSQYYPKELVAYAKHSDPTSLYQKLSNLYKGLGSSRTNGFIKWWKYWRKILHQGVTSCWCLKSSLFIELKDDTLYYVRENLALYLKILPH